MLVGLAALGVATPHTVHLSANIVHAPPRSRVASRLGNGSSIPAGGSVWPTGVYWSTLQIGTPPQDFPAAIDSGSGDLDISAKGCAGCITTPPNRGYDSSASSTSQPTAPYTFSNTYETCDLKHPTAPCTIRGKVYNDQVSIGGLGPVSVRLGAIEKQDTNFDQFKQIDGVVGFTGGGGEDVFSSLVAAGACDNVWAMCMHAGARSNGTLTLGGVDARLSSGLVTYVPDAGRSFHSVTVNAFALDGPGSRTVVNVGRAAILDTGTNVLLLPTGMLKRLGDAMCGFNASLASCDALWRNECVELTEAQVDAYPPLSLQLDGIDLDMSPRDYLLRGSPLAASAGQYCLGIRSGGNLFIIGDTTMRNYYLVFDYARGKIGWAPVNKAPGGCGDVAQGELAPEHVATVAP